MNSKIIYKIFIWLFFYGLLFSIFVNSCTSQEGDFTISITDKSYDVIKIDENNEIITYNIIITLTNEGNVKSDNMTIRIRDEDDINLTKQYTFNPGESKTFIFDEYPVIGLKDHEISIFFYPTIDEIYIEDNLNHGEDILVLKYGKNNEDNNTPGFSIPFIISIIAIYVLLNKNKK